jgi:hypothetical protein
VGGTVYVKRNEIKDHRLCGLFILFFASPNRLYKVFREFYDFSKSLICNSSVSVIV